MADFSLSDYFKSFLFEKVCFRDQQRPSDADQRFQGLLLTAYWRLQGLIQTQKQGSLEAD